MVGGATAVNKDVPPFAIVGRNPVAFESINIVGLRRRGFTNDQIEEIRNVYRTLYESGLNISDACRKVEAEFPQTEVRDTILNFVKSSSRGIVKPAK